MTRPAFLRPLPKAAFSAAVAITLAGLALAVPSAAQANFFGATEDPAGDATDPSPARDITAIGVSYDRRTGELRGGVRFRAAPLEATRGFITLVAGIRTPSGCNGYPAVAFGSYSDEWGASWLRLPAPNQPASARGDADKTGRSSAVQEFQATDKRMAGQRVNCVAAALSDPNDSNHLYDTVGPIALQAQPALEVKLGKAPRVLRPGRSYRMKLTLRNPGDAPTGRIRVKISRARGLTAKTTRTVNSLRAHARRTVTIKVTASRRAKTFTPLRVTATAGKLRARDETDLIVRERSKPSRSSGGGGGSGSGGSGLCARWQPDFTGESGGSLGLVPC